MHTVKRSVKINMMVNRAFTSAIHAAKRMGDYITIRFDAEMDPCLCWGHADKQTEALLELEATMGVEKAFMALKDAGVPVSAIAERELARGAYT